jgi:hypothetical protein
VFLQNYRGLGIIGFKGIIFLLKIPWNMSSARGPGPRYSGPLTTLAASPRFPDGGLRLRVLNYFLLV